MIFKEKKFQSLLFHYFKKFFIIFVFFIVLLMVCVYFAIFKNTYQEMHSNDLKTQNQVTAFIKNSITECERTYNALISNNNLTQFLCSDINSLDKKDYSDTVSTVKNIVVSNKLASSYTENIIVISQRNNLALSSSSDFPSTLARFQNYEWFNDFLKNKKSLQIKQVYYKRSSRASEEPILLILRKINTPFDSGYILFEINTTKLKNDIVSVLSDENMFFVLTDKIIVSSDKTDNLSSEELTAIRTNLSKKSSYATYRIFNSKITGYDLDILVFLDNSNYKKLTVEALFIFAFAFLIFIIFSIWISYILAKNTMDPISEIINIIDNPQITNTDIKINQSEEVQYITKNILKSVEDNKFYKEQLEKKLKELNESQEIALNNQIHPHFLFNTLETIHAVAFGLTKSENTAAKMIRMLSELLQISLRNDKKFITIEEEINHIRNYLSIQALRYSDRFEVEWDIDERILQFSTVKLILQPLCENAIYHGIKNADFFCYIKISAKEDKKKHCIVFKIENNGKTIDKKTLIALRKTLKDDKYSTAHIGLKNVNRRIKIAFGEKYGCDVFSDNEKTTVTVTIPKTKIL